MWSARFHVELARAVLAVVLVTVGVSAGCVNVEGGAVEVPWTIFGPDGRQINDCSCSDPAIARVRVDLESVDADGGAPLRPCDGRADCEFPCGRKIGATPFIVPPGSYLVSLVPVGDDGSDLALDRTDPVLRQVVKGQPTEVEAFVFYAPCSSACRGASPTEPCTSR